MHEIRFNFVYFGHSESSYTQTPSFWHSIVVDGKSRGTHFICFKTGKLTVQMHFPWDQHLRIINHVWLHLFTFIRTNIWTKIRRYKPIVTFNVRVLTRLIIWCFISEWMLTSWNLLENPKIIHRNDSRMFEKTRWILSTTQLNKINVPKSVSNALVNLWCKWYQLCKKSLIIIGKKLQLVF